MKKRVLSNGLILYQTRPPNSPHNIYYAEVGSDGGLAVVVDFNNTDRSLVSAAMAWEDDKEPDKFKDATPRVQFNKQGFRY